ncbi:MULTISPECIES: 50S ribosomal protein L25/general stress protein Ctc [unclassified Polaromonas]|jgi:large subunit ribosomal protein L25|uniref:50S ribosomal protein L25/general stress protein Ctc n=1 Tax=unclassified Polaromonas TaxID=2638319 RepID=UPI000BC4D4A6|nr:MULTISPECIES: 50S ribosomal protein L25/general stress protein Ctc [unclassified Polaromonas]OYY34730.1 MAG: 50S ribosomal protein L25/general stress protein Ctc [Polaromonas sp. 35-63-35]OYZ19384.1 MAG: 50S ribosomal protein L25/general stress protein Ctc [Polaromonas sp. 16-63-31]OYZ77489.1 MAG: 50S ribosomal protein L25/general stress protein Ctc [Polaromonas sp. 24-63-21]OZA48526.1 MAG: 50S ribosomal protein L25/general stress protein Ctc [Polaromonas sp. 17-63-33]OZA87277.1 MAG: 50S ri
MKFVAFERAKQGTGASRRLRITGRTPGIVYGGTGEPSLIELDHNALWHAIKKEAFHASVLEMELGGKTQKVLLRDLQMHPFKQLVLHIDFQRVDAKTRLTMKVPLHYSGQEESPAVKAENCLVNHVLTELSISCLPKDLPEFIAVDLSGLKKGTSLHVKDITLPKGVKFVAKGGMDNPVLVSVSAVSEEAEADAAAAAAAAAPVDPKAAKAAAAKEAKAGAKADAAKPAAKK